MTVKAGTRWTHSSGRTLEALVDVQSGDYMRPGEWLLDGRVAGPWDRNPDWIEHHGTMYFLPAERTADIVVEYPFTAP